MEEIRREDYDTYQDFVRAKNTAASQHIQLSRFTSMLALIRKYESAGMSDEDIVKQLSSYCEYKLVNSKARPEPFKRNAKRLT